MPDYEVWITHFHITTCSTCADLNGRIFPVSQGPQPPLHTHCHCKRQLTTTEPPAPPPPIAPPPRTTTIADDFDTYGGDAIAPAGSDTLFWLALIRGEGDPAESGGIYPLLLDNAHVIEGDNAIKLPGEGYSRWYFKTYTPAADLTADGRFTAADYLCLSVYSDIAEQIYIIFRDTALRYAIYIASLSIGWNYLAVKRSSFTIPAGFDWTQIELFGTNNAAPYAADTWHDDMRIVTADPDDAARCNDTGGTWQFDGGVWHIYQDSHAAAYALGQIDTTDTARSTAIRQGDYTASNHFSGGVYLREVGSAGLLAFVIDAGNCYEVKLDADAGTLSLIRWMDGNPYTLVVEILTVDPDVSYLVGLQREGESLRVYCAPPGQSVFAAASLVATASDATYSQGHIGFAAYGINTRYFSVRAGANARYAAEYTDRTDALGHLHADGLVWYEIDGLADRAAWDTETVTLPELARRMKALIDDLKIDRLIN